MNREEIFKRINKVLQDVFDAPELNVTESTVAADVDGWDSLKHVYVLVAIEQEFDVSFDLAETGDLENVGALADIIQRETA